MVKWTEFKSTHIAFDETIKKKFVSSDMQKIWMYVIYANYRDIQNFTWTSELYLSNISRKLNKKLCSFWRVYLITCAIYQYQKYIWNGPVWDLIKKIIEWVGISTLWKSQFDKKLIWRLCLFICSTCSYITDCIGFSD